MGLWLPNCSLNSMQTPVAKMSALWIVTGIIIFISVFEVRKQFKKNDKLTVTVQFLVTYSVHGGSACQNDTCKLNWCESELMWFLGLFCALAQCQGNTHRWSQRCTRCWLHASPFPQRREHIRLQDGSDFENCAKATQRQQLWSIHTADRSACLKAALGFPASHQINSFQFASARLFSTAQQACRQCWLL